MILKTSENSSQFLFRRIIFNTGFLLLSQTVALISAMLIGIMIARSMGQAIYGQYSLAFAFAGMANSLFTMGEDSIVVRQIAQAPENIGRVLSAALGIRVIGFPLAVIVAVVASQIFGYSTDQKQYILMAVIVMGLIAQSDLPRSIFQGLQTMKLDALSRTIEKAASLLLAWLFLRSLHTLTSVMLAIIGGTFTGLLVSWVMLTRLVKIQVRISGKESLSLFRQAISLAAGMFIVSITLQLPQVILSLFKSYQEVGLFSAAYNLITPISLLATALSGALLPVLSGYVHASRQSLDQFNESMISSIFLIGLPMTAGLALFSPNLMGMLYGSNFVPAAPALVILSFNVIPIFLAMYFISILIAFGAQHLYMWVTLCNLGMVLFINFLLVRPFGIISSSLSVLASGILAAVLTAIFTSRWVTHRINRRCLAAASATAVMTLGVLLAGSAVWWLRVFLAIGLYGLGLWITGGFTIKEFKSLMAIFFSRSIKSDQ
jgi:O-antigen/teichoic acid export membrane protein